MNNKRHLVNLPDGRLGIIQANCDDNDVSREAQIVAKTLFELGRGNLVPPADITTPKAIESWRMNLHFHEYTGPLPLATCGECLTSDLPTDRTFREAWEAPVGTIQVNMGKARVIQMDRIRKKRNEELQKLDIPFMMASERNDQEAVSKIAVQKQKLRDIPQKYDLSGFKTPEELKAAWPKELDEKIKDVKKGL
tara:strand:- start:184 stop:765 length:582 start_codon:yes stop_codon:yes gene_type:complete